MSHTQEATITQTTPARLAVDFIFCLCAQFSDKCSQCGPGLCPLPALRLIGNRRRALNPRGIVIRDYHPRGSDLYVCMKSTLDIWQLLPFIAEFTVLPLFHDRHCHLVVIKGLGRSLSFSPPTLYSKRPYDPPRPLDARFGLTPSVVLCYRTAPSFLGYQCISLVSV